MMNTQMTTNNNKQVKWMIGALAVLVLALANAQPTQAQLPSTTDSGPEVTRTRDKTSDQTEQPVNNPCTGETVIVDTHIRTETETRDQNGRFRFRFRTQENGNGFAPSGARYEYQAMSDNRTETTVNTFESRFEARQRLHRQGEMPPGVKRDDFFVRVRTRNKVVNGELQESRVEETRAEDQCK